MKWNAVCVRLYISRKLARLCGSYNVRFAAPICEVFCVVVCPGKL